MLRLTFDRIVYTCTALTVVRLACFVSMLHQSSPSVCRFLVVRLRVLLLDKRRNIGSLFHCSFDSDDTFTTCIVMLGY